MHTKDNLTKIISPVGWLLTAAKCITPHTNDQQGDNKHPADTPSLPPPQLLLTPPLTTQPVHHGKGPANTALSVRGYFAHREHFAQLPWSPANMPNKWQTRREDSIIDTKALPLGATSSPITQPLGQFSSQLIITCTQCSQALNYFLYLAFPHISWSVDSILFHLLLFCFSFWQQKRIWIQTDFFPSDSLLDIFFFLK